MAVEKDVHGRPVRGIPLAVPDVVADLRYPDIRDLAERLHFDPNRGRIWLEDRRMILINSEAFGALRQELIESLGTEMARGLLTRVGYLAGSRDAALARKIRPGPSAFESFMVGPQLHALQGVVQVEIVRLEMDSATGRCYGEFYWKDSSEDELHIAANGLGSEPACWMQTGYASGYTSAFMGKRVLVRELECRSMGNSRCRSIAKPAEEWTDPEADLKYLLPQPTEKRSRVVVRGLGTDAPPDATGTLAAGGPIGTSTGFVLVMHKIHRVADTSATVLLLGESGVGKTMFARELHKRSARAQGSFVHINCASIPEQLLEAELFGTEKGAYTGATEARAGRFEIGNGGTVFLDEVGTLSLTAQGKLLRILQTGEMERLGSTRTLEVDVRVLAASNENLQKAVKEGRFREDLFYRLNVFPILIPPLRERKDDIPLLLEALLQKFSQRHGRRLKGVTHRALQTLLNYSWPGNIRELENVVERGVILAEPDGALDVCHLFSVDESVDTERLLGLSDLGFLVPEAAPGPAAPAGNIDAWAAEVVQGRRASMSEVEDALVRAALEQTRGNISKAASLLGITRAQLDYRVKKRADVQPPACDAQEAPR